MGTKLIRIVLLTLVLAVGFVALWQWEESQQADQQSVPSTVAQSPLQAPTPQKAAPDSSAEKTQGSSAGVAVPGEEENPAAPAAIPAAVPAAPQSLLADGENATPLEAPAPQLVESQTATVPSEESAEAASEAKSEVTEDVIKGTLSKGDTVSKLLEPHADAGAVQDIVTATRRVFPLTSFRAGQPYVVICDVQSGAVKRFEYEIDRKRKLVVEEQEGAPIARVEAIEYDVELALVGARIDDNLFQSVADIGESPQLALLVANLFGWEINFIRDLQEGDSYSVLVEKLYRDGQFKGYGRTLGATFTNKGKTYEAFLYHDGQGREHHFNVRGENLKKVLLQAPLSFTRVTSGYTKSRKHPIFGDHRAHFGVDYGAPSGTPVKAVGDGTVTLRGWAGGYGNQVVVKHGAGLESMYSHLSGFARGIAKGSRVRQGQVIAFVGSTGNSTGPHLDFRLKQQGQFVNPTKAVNPRSEPVAKPNMVAFQKRMDMVREFMSGERAVSSYTPELMAAPQASSTVLAKAAEEVKQKEEKKEEKPAKKKRQRGRKRASDDA